MPTSTEYSEKVLLIVISFKKCQVTSNWICFLECDNCSWQRGSIRCRRRWRWTGADSGRECNAEAGNSCGSWRPTLFRTKTRPRGRRRSTPLRPRCPWRQSSGGLWQGFDRIRRKTKRWESLSEVQRWLAGMSVPTIRIANWCCKA